MTEITRPDFTYQWASGGALVTPSTTKIQTGWVAEVPPYQWENFSQNRQDNAIVHLFQKGISVWSTTQDYYFTTGGTHAYVQGSDGRVYEAVQSSTGQNPVTDTTNTYWKLAFRDQSGSALYALDTGSANVYTVAYSPVVVSLTDGMVLRFKVKTANTAASTFAPNGVSASPVVGGAHTALQGGELIANGDAWVQWNTSIGAGSWVLLFCTGGAEQVAKATKSQHAVQQSQLGNYSGLVGISASTTLSSSQLGMLIPVTTGATTQTLPPVATLLSGSTYILASPGGITTVKANGAELIANTLNATANTILINQGEILSLTTDGTRWYISSYTQSLTSISGAGSFSNLVVSTSGIGNSVGVTANQLVLTNAAGAAIALNSVSLSASLIVSGPNGLDTGTVAAGTWYYVFAIYNPTTQTRGELLSLSATAPTLPSGFTYFLRVSAIRTDSTANKFALSMIQNGRRAQYKLVASSNVSTVPVMASGVFSSAFTAVSVSGFVPPTASAIRGTVYQGNLNSITSAAPNAAYTISSQSSASGGVGSLSVPTNGDNGNFPYDFLLESSNIYFYSTGSAGTLTCYGWDDNL